MRAAAVLVAALAVVALAAAAGPPLPGPEEVAGPASRARRQAVVVHGLVTVGLLQHQPLTLVIGDGGSADGAALSGALRWRRGVTVHYCAPCDNQTLYSVLLAPKSGLKLLVGDQADFEHLNSVEARHWVGGEVALLPTPTARCRRLFRLPLLAKISLPLCVEVPPAAGRPAVVLQRGYDGSVRSESAARLLSGAPHHLLGRHSYHGRYFETYFVDFLPYFVCGDADQVNGQLCREPLPGPDASIMQIFAERVNLSLHFRSSPDGGWGHIENGTWVGNVGEVWRGHADAAVAGLFVNGERSAAVHFSEHTAIEEVALVSGRVPLGQQISLGGLLPVSSWAVVGVLALLVAAAGTLLTRPAAADTGRVLVHQAEDAFRGLWAQSLTRLPADTPRRLLVSVWTVGCIVLGTALITGLAAQLTAPRVYWAPMTLWDAVEHDYQVVTHENYGSYDTAMRSPQSPLFDGLRARWVKGNNLKTMYRMLDPSDRVCLLEEIESYVTMRNKMIIETEGRVRPENIRLANQRAFTFMVSYAVQRNTPLLDVLNALMKRLKETGLVQHWIRLMRRREELQVTAVLQRAPPPPRVAPLPLSRLSTTLELLVTGWALAGVVFGLELLAFRCRSWVDGQRGEVPVVSLTHIQPTSSQLRE